MPPTSRERTPRADTQAAALRRAECQRQRAERGRAKFERLVERKRMYMDLLDQVGDLLRAGDTAAAIGLLDNRRDARAASRARREAAAADRAQRALSATP